jgi:hypothetical protein
MASTAAIVFRGFGLSSAKRSILMLVLVWIVNIAWLGLNYFWRIASINVLLAILVLSLVYAIMALVAYIYWGMRDVQERHGNYANLLVGAIVAITLFYFNFDLLQIVLDVVEK